jgi:hypothetical protein
MQQQASTHVVAAEMPTRVCLHSASMQRSTTAQPGSKGGWELQAVGEAAQACAGSGPCVSPVRASRAVHPCWVHAVCVAHRLPDVDASLHAASSTHLQQQKHMQEQQQLSELLQSLAPNMGRAKGEEAQTASKVWQCKDRQPACCDILKCCDVTGLSADAAAALGPLCKLPCSSPAC